MSRTRLARITKELRKYDRELYCDTLSSGIPAIFRRTVRQEIHPLEAEQKSWLVVFKDAPHLVFPLTDTWKANGQVVEWGIEPIMARLKAMDLWQNPLFAEDLIKSYEKSEESRAKDKRNNMEDFFYEMHSKFKEDWKNINTATVAKKDRRRIDEKRIKGV